MENSIIVRDAHQHNLKNINLKIPKNKLVVFTGISGSGKSSLAFDTIYAEGQRRYVESLSAYARQFLGIMDKPDVESIAGLSPAISIDQKSSSHNPRSTVGTITEIYDYLRLLFARIGHPHCPKCGREISKQSPQQISQAIIENIKNKLTPSAQTRFLILSPVVRDKKGEFTALFDNLRGKGFQRVRIDGTIFELDEDFVLIKTNKHTIEVVIDRIVFSKKQLKDQVSLANLKSRVSAAVEQSLNLSDGLVILTLIEDKGFDFPAKPKKQENHLFSELFSCPVDNISLPEIEPRTFSFNSPHGACPQCNGIGNLLKVDPELIINQELSINQGAILPYSSLTSKDTWTRRTIFTVLESYQESPDTPFKHLAHQIKEILLFGKQDQVFTVYGTNRFGRTTSYDTTFEGIINTLNRRYIETKSEVVRTELEKFMRKEECSACNGKRLTKEALSITVKNLNISQLSDMQISSALAWLKELTKNNENNDLIEREKTIASPIIKELDSRLNFLTSVGLSYLTISREANTLSGGEMQRIRLASQIGSGLSGVLYVLDEPSVGLHQIDNHRLITTLKNLRDLGNTVIVVEHDRPTMENADWIVDFGPGAGKHGGKIVAQGSLAKIKSTRSSLTGRYLANKKHIKTIKSGQKQHLTSKLTLTGCEHHNLKNISVSFPLGKLICVTGVSGSGKSTLIHDILFHAIKRELNFMYRIKPGKFQKITGIGDVKKVRLIDQSPIGRTPRSNPVTYTKVFDFIRKIYANTKESAIRGYKPGRFSFNVRGGRCEACQGEGQVKIEMQFLSDVYVTCEVCHGKRYNEETLQVKYKGKSISDVLHQTVDEALEFFELVPNLSDRLKLLQDVGLGYIELGQPAPTLSGGEAQRIKIARELSGKQNADIIYLLDEPTTGLHFADLEKLLAVLRRLVDAGNTVIIIEHNLDIVKNADHIIDLGPDGGDNGGEVVASGTPIEIAKNKKSYTGQVLKKVLSIKA